MVYTNVTPLVVRKRVTFSERPLFLRKRPE